MFLPAAPKLDPNVQLTPLVSNCGGGQSELGGGGSGVEEEVKRAQLFALTDVQAKGGKVDKDGLAK